MELESGNEHYDEENYRAVETNIEKMAWSIRYDVGDTVECVITALIDGQNTYKTYKISGFVTRCTNEWDILYVRGINIRPTSTALTRMMLTEKTITAQW